MSIVKKKGQSSTSARSLGYRGVDNRLCKRASDAACSGSSLRLQKKIKP